MYIPLTNPHAARAVRVVVIILYVAHYVVSVRADTWLGAASMPASWSLCMGVVVVVAAPARAPSPSRPALAPLGSGSGTFDGTLALRAIKRDTDPQSRETQSRYTPAVASDRHKPVSSVS